MKNKVLLILVILFFLVTRLYKIASIPGSVYWDEASIGYNAFSIATDLKDEWGDTLPLHFRAFGEFKLPVYIYSVVPFVKILGLNAYAVRIPSVLYSVGSILLIYFLGKKISGKESVGILSAFLLSISPWMFIFSRTGYEAVSGLFFFLLGTYLMLLTKVSRKYYVFGVLAFCISFYSYNSFRIIIPPWLVVMTLMTFQKKNILVIILSALVFTASLFPVYRLYKFDTGGARFAQVEVKSKKDIVKNYFSNFSPQFLFTKGDTNPRSQVPGRGQLYYLDIPFILMGLIFILKNKKLNYLLPIMMLALSPIPAAITKESPHALRAILSAPSFAIISAFGVYFLIENFKKVSKYIYITVGVAYLIFFGTYYYEFLTNYSAKTRDAWQYQYKEIFLNTTKGTVTDEYAQPYIFALFYQKTNPSLFRSTVKYNPPDKWGFSLVSSFNGFEFKKDVSR